MTADEIVAGVLAQGGFPTSQQALVYGWVNEVHRKVVAETQWMMQTVTLATTVAGQTDYDIPSNVVDIVGLYLDAGSGAAGESQYSKVSTTDMWEIRAGRRQLRGSGGVFAPDYGSLGEKRIELYPAPTVTGTAIVALAAVSPATLVAGSSPVIPEDMHGDLLDGAIALGLLRMDERGDAASLFDARYREMVGKLQRRKNSRIGSRTARMQLHGSDWR